MRRLEEHERAHVVAGSGERLPLEAAPGVRAARLEALVDGKARHVLVGVVVEERLGVPGIDERRFGGGERDRAAVGCLERGIAAHVIGVAMRVHE